MESATKVDPVDGVELISALPRATGAGNVPVLNYNGFWIPDFVVPAVIPMQQHFKARPTDVLLTSTPKSGTTWLKALIFAITNRKLHHPSSLQHPLLNANPHDVVPPIVAEFLKGTNLATTTLDALPSPRLLHTHLPHSLLPPSVAESGCRIVYVCRDPKDTLVSGWHFWWSAMATATTTTTTTTTSTEKPSFSQVFELGCQGISMYGPLWDHCLEYWRESLRQPHKILFLKYEEMIDDPAGKVKRLADFLGCPFSHEELDTGIVEEIVKLCSFQNLSGMVINSAGVHGHKFQQFQVKHSSFFRKGKIGDWVNHMTPEMAERLDGITQQKLHGSGLVM